MKEFASEREELEYYRRMEELARREQMEQTGSPARNVEEDVARVKDLALGLGSGLAQGSIGLLQLPALPFHLASPGDSVIFNALQAAKRPFNYAPETVGGKYGKSVGESVPGSLVGPGGLVAKSSSAIGSGVGAEMADTLFDQGQENWWAKSGGALVGGVLPWLASAKVQNADQLVHEALSQTKPGDFRRAERIAKILADNEITANLNSQLLGPRSTLDDLVFEASAYSHTKPLLETKVGPTVQQVGNAINKWTALNTSPVSSVVSKREVLDTIQDSARSALDKVEAKANAAYAAAMPKGLQQYPERKMIQMLSEILDLANSAKYRGPQQRTILSFVQKELIGPDGRPVTDPYTLNNTIKMLNLKIKSDPNYAGLPEIDVKNILKKYTPEFDAARSAKRQVMVEEFNPRMKGLTGQVAEMGGGVRPDKYTARETLFKWLFDPTDDRSREISAFADDIGEDAFTQLFSKYMETQSAKFLHRGAELNAPYKFSLEFSKTPQQMRNINAALRIVARSNGANEQEVVKGFSNLIRAFDSYKDLVLAKQLNRAELGARVGVNVFGVAIAPHSRAGRVSYDIVARRTYDKITKMVTDPNGLKTLEFLARNKPTSARMKAFIEGLVTTTLQGLSAEDQSSTLLDSVLKGK